ncbi:fungal-specific transcription factor domain-containing protein [Xylaria bambusicola]|uniref:fungal-specific transcription factor domain-containing protein n=1 Tax=Xylaria bambusicola TaxID=326684 RepID=UPI0020080D66|nr:fungal-specific transcription factor domain-containing protein [Xylaria bambusicola]KAI0526696.1 fungal-specific transcription factor domain-containing protein [Xylaria bambusicola]
METVRRTQGCWTCKRRKIGCDRGYPACNNCLRTGRECLGYGIRLAWPDQPDGRRRGSRIPDQALHSSPHIPLDYGKQFLNMTYDDLMHSGKGLMVLNELLLLRSQPRPIRSIPLLPKIHERESHLLSYYHDKLSRMISTINVNNGFRDDLIPMALSSDGKASHGLRNAILAVSAFHLWGPEHAFSYKAEAIRSLSSSLSTESFGTTETQLATSMMLCVYNVFDETEGNWSLHLYGAQKILHQLASIHGGHLAYRFLYTWFLYHEVLGGFSQPLKQWPNGPASLRLLRDTRFDTSMIIGSLGCSVEVMEIISCVNMWRAMELQGYDVAMPGQEKPNKATEYKALENRIFVLTQRLDPRHEEHLSRHDRIRTLATAELYRIATYLYLHRIGSTETSQDTKSLYIHQALQILGSLEVCTSPWPLFVIACETENDDQRISILRTLDRMDVERHIGNVFVLRHIIESFWKQQDLQADSGKAGTLKWWDTIDLNLSAPWFI